MKATRPQPSAVRFAAQARLFMAKWREEMSRVTQDDVLFGYRLQLLDCVYVGRPRTDGAIWQLSALSEAVQRGVPARGSGSGRAPRRFGAHPTRPITAVQSEYSLWTRDPEDQTSRPSASSGSASSPTALSGEAG